MAEPLLEVDDLSVDYLTSATGVRAVDRVSFAVEAGEFLGIVGESGCGKSTLLFAVGQLLSPPGEVVGGKVVFNGRDMVRTGAFELPAHAVAGLLGGDAERDERAQPDEEHRCAVQGHAPGARQPVELGRSGSDRPRFWRW